MRAVSATEFKAKCLSLLDQVQDEGGAITITKRGRPVAVLGPVKRRRRRSPEGIWAGKVKFLTDLATAETSHLWNVTRD